MRKNIASNNNTAAPASNSGVPRIDGEEARLPTILRPAVIEFLKQTESSAQKPPWKLLQSIDDWKEYFDLHSNWHGRSTTDMQKDKDSGAATFYNAFVRWIKKNSQGNAVLYRELIEAVLTPRKVDWSSLRTMENWKAEFAKNPLWQGRSVKEMHDDRASGALKFYVAFNKWAKEEARGDYVLYKKLMQTLFPPKYNDWKTIRTIEDWRREFADHPEWKRRSTFDMHKDKVSGAAKFYVAFHQWAKREAKGDDVVYNKLLRTLFPVRQRNWTSFTTIDSWKAEFVAHPEWYGRSMADMKKDSASGARAFYMAFSNWAKKEVSGQVVYYRNLIESIFPLKQNDWSALKTIDDWKGEFAKHPEWQERTRGEMLKDYHSGAAAFHQAFHKWVKKEANGISMYAAELHQQIFPGTKLASIDIDFSYKNLAKLLNGDLSNLNDIVKALPSPMEHKGWYFNLNFPERKSLCLYLRLVDTGTEVRKYWVMAKSDLTKFADIMGVKVRAVHTKQIPDFGIDTLLEIPK